MVVLSLIWLFKTVKYVLFWLYLWQLKEYHTGRFVDHFRTAKGRELIFNYSILVQVILLALFLSSKEFTPILSFILLAFYLFQSAAFIRQILVKTLKKPVPTSKSLVLIGLSFLGLLLFFGWSGDKSPAWLILFDVLLPVLVSAVVLLLQPFSVFLRDRYVKKAAKRMALFPNIKVIAITGSYGKTSTKEFLKTILSKRYKVLATKDHQNSEVGIARSILHDLDESHEIFIAEVGAYNKGKVREVCSFLKPVFGVVTGVNEQHLSLFGSMANLLSAEGGGELDKMLRPGGVLFVNGDNRHCVDLYKKTDNEKRMYATSGKKMDADMWAEEVLAGKDSVTCITKNKKGELANIRAKVLGKHYAENLLGAALVANELGMSLAQIAEAAKHIVPEQAGMTVKENNHHIHIIDSSYSANPDGVMADLNYLSLYEGKRVVIMPCLIELGKKSKEIHFEIGKKIARTCNMAIITSNDHFLAIKEGAMQAGMSEHNILLCENKEDIHSLVTLFCKAGDAVLLEGSRPMKGLTELMLYGK